MLTSITGSGWKDVDADVNGPYTGVGSRGCIYVDVDGSYMRVDGILTDEYGGGGEYAGGGESYLIPIIHLAALVMMMMMMINSQALRIRRH